jgi:two-component system response regulator PilR (NtrC family)
MIHEQGARSAAPFVPVNCGAIPAELMESEFFGHVKGSFTGANTDKQGLFQAANGGTLFLDEVAELPLHMQVKLLRSIQEKAVRPIGAQHEHPVDVRILSASHKNLVDLVQEGLFRKDLYYRINVIELNVPGLRDRSEDIPALANQIMQTLASKSGLEKVPRLDKSALTALMDYPFPGNVRELENILERALAMAESDIINQDGLHLHKTGYTEDPPNTEPLNIAGTEQAGTGLAETERQAIMQALEKTRWNKTAAAKLLGLSLRQLRYRLEKLDIE